MKVCTDKELNRYSISLRDFEKALEFLSKANNHLENDLIRESLLISGLICYCRPFTSNERNKNAQATTRLDFNSFTKMSVADHDLHKQCMLIRNKAIAHAEWSNYPTSRDTETNVICSHIYCLRDENIDWNGLEELANKLRNQCHHLRADFLSEKRL